MYNIVYVLKVTVPEEFVVLMSAVEDREPKFEKNGKKTYFFSQTVPVPAYLVAIAVGNLESRKVGPRSRVWAEPEIVEKAEYEFAEVFRSNCSLIRKCFVKLHFAEVLQLEFVFCVDRLVVENGRRHLRTLCLENIRYSRTSSVFSIRWYGKSMSDVYYSDDIGE